jgi:hypothetical protein
MLNVWAAGFDPPVVNENVIDVGLGDRVGWLVTLRVIVSASGLFPASAEVMVTWPV